MMEMVFNLVWKSLYFTENLEFEELYEMFH